VLAGNGVHIATPEAAALETVKLLGMVAEYNALSFVVGFRFYFLGTVSCCAHPAAPEARNGLLLAAADSRRAVQGALKGHWAELAPHPRLLALLYHCAVFVVNDPSKVCKYELSSRLQDHRTPSHRTLAEWQSTGIY